MLFFLFFFSCASVTFSLAFFFCTLKVCKPRHRRWTNLDLNHWLSFQSVFVSGQLSPQIEEDMLQYVYLFYLDFYFLIFRNGKKKMFVVMCSLALWTWQCCHLFKWPWRVIDCTYICLPSAYIIMIYWSYLSMLHYPDIVCVCVCVKLHTHTQWSMTVFSCSLVAALLTLFPRVRSVPPGCFFLFKHLSHFLSFPSQQHNQIS